MTQDNNRFYIDTEFPGFGDVGSPVIKDKTTGETVCEDVYDTLNFLNELTNETKEKAIYTMTVLELIKNKDQTVMAYNKFMKKYRETEAKLLIDTDFSEALGKSRTNKEERDAYVNREMAKEKLARAEYENSIDILNDLIRLRQKEVKPE